MAAYQKRRVKMSKIKRAIDRKVGAKFTAWNYIKYYSL